MESIAADNQSDAGKCRYFEVHCYSAVQAYTWTHQHYGNSKWAHSHRVVHIEPID